MQFKLTEMELDVVRSVFLELEYMPYDKLNTFLGTQTIKEMSKIRRKIECREWCEKNRKRYEDLTDDDLCRIYCDTHDC